MSLSTNTFHIKQKLKLYYLFKKENVYKCMTIFASYFYKINRTEMFLYSLSNLQIAV